MPVHRSLPRLPTIAITLIACLLPGCAAVELQKTADGICTQPDSGLMWQQDGSGPFHSWEAAKAYADELTLGGYSDWRLPTTTELYVLHNILELKPRGGCRPGVGGSLWSGATKAEASVGYWESYPLCGGSEYRYHKGKHGHVLAVRP